MQAGLSLYWLQRLINFGVGRIRIKSYLRQFFLAFVTTILLPINAQRYIKLLEFNKLVYVLERGLAVMEDSLVHVRKSVYK